MKLPLKFGYSFDTIPIESGVTRVLMEEEKDDLTVTKTIDHDWITMIPAGL